MDNEELLHRWTQYCDDLYNFQLHTVVSIQKKDQHFTDEDETSPSILKEDVVLAIKSLEHFKLHVVDNISSELVRHGGEENIKTITITALFQKKWPNVWT